MTWLVLLLIWDYLIYVHLYENINNNLFHLNKLPGHKRSSPPLLSSLLRQDIQRWLISMSNCISSCFLHAPVGDPFAKGAIHSTIWIHWVELRWSSPRAPRICGNLWNIAHSRMNERAAKLRIADLRQVVALTTGMLTFSHINYTRTLQLCFVLPNKIRIQFRFHSHSVIDYVKYC